MESSAVRKTAPEFQFTRPRGARLKTFVETFNWVVVSIHAPTGGATGGFGRVMLTVCVSIHAPTGGATHAETKSGTKLSFQFTRPRGARRNLPGCCAGSRRFNSRAHGGRDPCRPYRTCDCWRRFQFTRPRGARHRSRKRRRKTCGFQFTRPRGARLALDREVHDALRVSIHAPTGGATACRTRPRGSRQFQFTRPRGARLRSESVILPAFSFQFTRPRGARHWRAPGLQGCSRVSIHAPTGGATAANRVAAVCRHVSIHAPTGGATSPASWCAAPRRRFNSRAHGGRDRQCRKITD